MSLQASLLSLTRRRWLAAVGASLVLAACAPILKMISINRRPSLSGLMWLRPRRLGV